MKIQRTDTNSTILWGSLAVLVVFVYFFGLNVPLLGPDEARYAQVAREMFERGDWVTPTLGGFHWFEKPALLYWLQITFYHIFGVSEFAARLGSALFGLGTITALWVLGRNIATEATEKTHENNASVSSVANFPNYLALIAATSLGILVFSRGASFDIIVTFPMTAAMVSFYISDRATGKTWREKYLPLTLFYVFIGVSLLAKGLIGILFPFAIVAFYHLLSWRFPGRTFLLSLFWGTFLAIVVASVWYLPMYQRNGWEFIDEFLIQHHFQRFTSNKYQHPQPFFFFLWVLPLTTFPWVPFFFVALWKSAKSMFRFAPAFRRPENSSPLVIFAFSWLLVPLVFFSISGSKLPGYILPAVPAAIILVALVVFGLVEENAKWRKIVLTTAVLTLVGIVALLLFAVPKFADSDSVKSLISAANARGFAEQRVMMVYTLSHNAEFYAPGRLLRDATGKQKAFYHVDDLLPYLARENGKAALILVPIEHLTVLTNDTRITANVLKDNTELAIVEVAIR
ncbi:MAG: glycosyltransferase family 39 protein [Pyrinomonadaceae bacterium]